MKAKRKGRVPEYLRLKASHLALWPAAPKPHRACVAQRLTFVVGGPSRWECSPDGRVWHANP